MRLTGISSMATRLVLAELAEAYAQQSGVAVVIESVGGVDAARRVAAGEAFDLVVLGADAMAKLQASGNVLADSVLPLVDSATALAVARGAPPPDISSEAALRDAVVAAASLAYSSGPSGVALAALFERWGITESIRGRIVTPPPGKPVGKLVADGEVEVGFQQLSELLHVDGINIVGTLPPSVAIKTIFSGGVCATSTQPDAVRALLRFMASPAATPAKLRQGMKPA